MQGRALPRLRPRDREQGGRWSGRRDVGRRRRPLNPAGSGAAWSWCCR